MKKQKTAIKLINTHQAKSELSSLIRSVEEDNVVVRICRNGKPIVELVKVATANNPLLTNKALSNIKFYETPTVGADEKDWPKENR